jgi:hypothetical protein
MRKRRRPEDSFQRSVCAFLEIALPHDATWFAVPNGGVRSPIEAAIMKGLGVKAGAPDILCFWSGRGFAIELKRPPVVLKSGKVSSAKPDVSDAQEAMHARLQAAGVPVCVAQSLEAVADFLVGEGVPLRARVGAAQGVLL